MVSWLEEFPEDEGEDDHEEDHEENGDRRVVLLVGGVVAFALPFFMQIPCEVAACVASGLLLFGVVETGLVVELSGFSVVKKRECHNRIF